MTATNQPQMMPLRVTRNDKIADGIHMLEFRDAGGQPLPEFSAGAHIAIQAPNGALRKYSLCNDPAERERYLIAVKREVNGRGGSIDLIDHVKAGDQLMVAPPVNDFRLPQRAQEFLFIAGGIGITPILPMLARAEQFGIDWSMLYVGRSRDSLPFLDELARFGDRVQIRTDDVDGLPTADDLLGDCRPGTSVYTCGPAPMLGAIRTRLVGADDIELHFERFAVPPVTDGHEFKVEVASTGQTVAVAADETLLTALIKAGVHAPYSCQQGFCGTCRVKVLAGAVDHRDGLLTETEREAGQALICVSRAQGDGPLTLDL